MSDGQVLGMVGMLLFYAAVGLGIFVGVCLLANDIAYRIEAHYARRRRRARSDVVERCNVYRLRSADVVPLRPRRNDDAA